MDAATAPAPVLSPSSKPTGAAALVSPSEPTHAAQADAPAAAVDAPAAAVDVDVAPKKPRRRKGRRPMLSRAAPRSEEDDEARRRALQKRAAEKQARAEAGRKAREAATVAKAKVAQDRIRAAHAKLAAELNRVNTTRPASDLIGGVGTTSADGSKMHTVGVMDKKGVQMKDGPNTPKSGYSTMGSFYAALAKPPPQGVAAPYDSGDEAHTGERCGYQMLG